MSSRPSATSDAKSKIHQVSPEFEKSDEEKNESNKNPEAVLSGLHVGGLLRVWADVSKINYMSSKALDVITSVQSVLRRKSIGLPITKYSVQDLVPTDLRTDSEEDMFAQQFPNNVTSLMNEDNLWGCFYTFPEIYADVYSPVVHIRNIKNVPELVGAVLTRDMVDACLSYLKRTPILGDFVFIKLDLSAKHIVNIEVLQHYKYLVYLDLSSNLLTELTVLSHLPYLQYLSVAFNRLNTVLEYDTPQWFLSEVHYKFNSVKRIRDLTIFWSLTILDLSHNNIKGITGLENLKYLRRLDLSFNHIQRLENLNHLRLLWLDLSYNNISSFEFGPNSGLWTLLHLEYLNLNENNLTSMKMFSYCTRLREVHARNNRLSMLLELAVYMRQLRRLIVLDLRANPICSNPGYKDVVINTFPLLLSLDAQELDPVEQRTSKMEMTPDITTHASRRLLRLLYIEQLNKALVSQYVPPADTTDVPIVILVGYEGVGKGTLARRLASECRDHIEIAYQHTTAPYHSAEHYRAVSRSKFDEMLLHGEFLTYSELDGESYGLSTYYHHITAARVLIDGREEAFVKDAKVRVVSMDLVGALMLKLRGYRPYLILVTSKDKRALAEKQRIRKTTRNLANQQRLSLVTPLERSALQVLLSGRIIITGILNEILLCLPEEKQQSEFLIESECSLMMDSEARAAVKDYARGINILALLASSATSLEDSKRDQDKNSQMEPSLYSLYKESQGTDEYNSYNNGQNSYQERNQNKKPTDTKQAKKTEKPSSFSQAKSVDFSRYTSSTWKGFSVMPDGSKSSKSVTFTSQDNTETAEHLDPTGMLIEPRADPEKQDKKQMRSISARAPLGTRPGSRASADDSDLWLAFLTETGQLQASDTHHSNDENIRTRKDTKVDDPNVIIHQMDIYNKISSETYTTHIRADYEHIHRNSPGLFWDTVNTDVPDEAFHKAKSVIRDIVNSQKDLKPMFDIDFVNMEEYTTVQDRLISIRNEIAPRRLFF